MRVSSFNCHCPLLCCWKSSVTYYPPCPLKLQQQDAQDVALTPAPSDEKVVIEQNGAEDGKVDTSLKGNLKKPRVSYMEQVRKGNVKWMDLVGKELVEIKEYETIEREEPEDYTDGSRACICVIQ